MITGILALGIVCMIFGCGKKGEEKKDEEKKEEAQKVEAEAGKADYQIIGTESEDAYKLLLTNNTGDEIRGISVKLSSEPEYPESMMKTEDKILEMETVCMYIPKKSEMEANADSDKALRATYDMKLSYADSHEVLIAGLGLDDMEEAELCFEDEVGFVKYMSIASKQEVNTKDMALALKAQKEAEAAAAAQAAEDAAAAQAQAAAEAAAQQAQQDAAAAAPVQDQPVDSGYNTYEPDYQPEDTWTQDPDPGQSGGGDSSGVGQSGEGCLGDAVLRQ